MGCCYRNQGSQQACNRGGGEKSEGSRHSRYQPFTNVLSNETHSPASVAASALQSNNNSARVTTNLATSRRAESTRTGRRHAAEDAVRGGRVEQHMGPHDDGIT